MSQLVHHATARTRSFFSTLVIGVTCVITTAIVCASAATLYGMRIVERNADNLFAFAGTSLDRLPELAESLPPALADLLADRRTPEYVDQLDVAVSLAESPHGSGRLSPLIQVRNRGDQVVSLLSLRVVIVDEEGRPVAENNEWAATPLAADDDWRGPLLPGSTRSFTADGCRVRSGWHDGVLRAEAEITDVRTWNGTTPTESSAATAEERSTQSATELAMKLAAASG
ncbi:MAG: hypothetical protein HOP29_06855 [Phycisphaerales bacterium]|nr:hypothetical protein [Phycisphaerales bacterium]